MKYLHTMVRVTDIEQSLRFYRDALGLSVNMRLTTYAVRTIEHNGGLDAYLLGTSDAKLSVDARRLKRRVEIAQAKRQAQAEA